MSACVGVMIRKDDSCPGLGKTAGDPCAQALRLPGDDDDLTGSVDHDFASSGKPLACKLPHGTQPPSTRRLVPVTKLARSLARNSTASAISWTSATRPKGVRFSYCATL